MEQFGFCGYSCSPVPPLPANHPILTEKAHSSDHFSIELLARHENQFRVFNVRKFLLLSCEEVLSDNGPLLLRRFVFNHYYFMPESFIDEATPTIINFCRRLFDFYEEDRRTKPSEDRRHLIMPMRLDIFVLPCPQPTFEYMEQFRTVPASEEAIESLKKVNLSGESSGVEDEVCCAICLDKLSDEGVKMPCPHVYHQDCIVRWLKRSNSCPQCRHQLP